MTDSHKNVLQLHAEGLQQVIDTGSVAEADKAGVLRGGNAGFIDAKGKPASSCIRRAVLRYHAVEVEPTEVDKQLMFDGGLASEDYFVDRIKSAWNSDTREVKCEDEVPAVWETSNGIRVTGRPDAVLFEDGKAVKGIEKKAIFSLWTARDILERRPKLLNLAQATNYMQALDLDSWELIYVNRNFFAANEIASRVLPKYQQKWSEYLSYRFYRWQPKQSQRGWTLKQIEEEEFLAADRTSIVEVELQNKKTKEWYTTRKAEYEWQHGNINPFQVSYEMRKSGPDGQIEVRDTTDTRGKWVNTPVSVSNVRAWYEMADTAITEDKLPPPPTNPKLGKSRDSYSLCNYCPLNKLCKSSTTKSTSKWVEESKQFLKSTVDNAK